MKQKIKGGLIVLIMFMLVSTAYSFDLVTNVVSNESINTTTNIYNNDSVDVWINGVRWTDVPGYIASNEGSWTTDTQGINEYTLRTLLNKFAKMQTTNKHELSDDQMQIYNALTYVMSMQTDAQLQTMVYPYLDALKQQADENTYMVEAMGGLLEGMYPEQMCVEKRKVMHKYNLTSVRCGDQICYNGEIVTLYNGKDTCVFYGDQPVVLKENLTFDYHNESMAVGYYENLAPDDLIPKSTLIVVSLGVGWIIAICGIWFVIKKIRRE